MYITVINGSPRGKYSTTLQTVLYLEKRFSGHTFTVLNAGASILSYEKDFAEAKAALMRADLILFAYPVYTFLAPSQLHRFLAKMKASGIDLAGKYATQITTSKHFYDVTAHRYVEENCFDMGLRVIHGLSADMEDLLSESGRADAERFLAYALHCVENGISEPAPAPKPSPAFSYTPQFAPVEKKTGFDTVLLTDAPAESPLRAMIADFTAVYPYPVRVVDIGDFPFRGGCLGCFHCAGKGECIYRDGFSSFLRDQIQSADTIVTAFTIVDHSMGTRFKTFDDRQFCNGHRTVTEGKPIAYLTSPDYPYEENVRTVLEARASVGGNFLAGVGYDAETLRSTANRLAYALEHRYTQPRSFYGVGGMKIFRDLIWVMRGLMKADHLFYKAHGVYDFPQKQFGKMLKMCLLGALVRNPKIKARMGNKMNEAMIEPYQKVIAAAVPKVGQHRNA